MKYTLLGTGRMARFIADKSAAAGWECLGVWGRDKEKASIIAQIVTAPVLENLEALKKENEAVLLAVGDAAIRELAQALPAGRSTVIHFSGILPVGILRPHPNRAVCWPVYSITGEVGAEIQIPFAGESSSAAARKVLTQLAGGLGGTLTQMDAAQRAQLHLAAVLVNNFVNHLLLLGDKIAGGAGLSFQMLQPIIAQTAARAAGGATGLLQTGPAVRGDVETEAAHLQLLAQNPKWVWVYEALSNSIKALSKSKAE